MDVKRRYVIPGDVIATGPLRPEQNVYQDGDRIISSSIGISEILRMQSELFRSQEDTFHTQTI